MEMQTTTTKTQTKSAKTALEGSALPRDASIARVNTPRPGAVRFLRPDRQSNFGGSLPALWPDPPTEKDKISVDRVTEKHGPHRFTIVKGDTVSIYIGEKEFKQATVQSISHRHQSVKVDFRDGSTARSFNKQLVFPALDPQQIAAREKLNEQLEAKANQIVDQGIRDLTKGLKKGDTTQLKNFFQFLAQNNYSFQNAQLIWFQIPEATRLADKSKWLELGRSVKDKELDNSIVIWVPTSKVTKSAAQNSPSYAKRRFVPKSVYDLSQTTGTPIENAASLRIDPSDAIERLKRLIQGDGLTVKELPTSATDYRRSQGELLLHANASKPAQLNELLTEYALYKLEQKDDREQLQFAARETEAEAVASIVCSYLGINSPDRSANYICLYGKPSALRSSLYYIHHIASSLKQPLASHSSEETPPPDQTKTSTRPPNEPAVAPTATRKKTK